VRSPADVANTVNFDLACDVIPSSNPGSTDSNFSDDLLLADFLNQEEFCKVNLAFFSVDNGGYKIICTCVTKKSLLLKTITHIGLTYSKPEASKIVFDQGDHWKIFTFHGRY